MSYIVYTITALLFILGRRRGTVKGIVFFTCSQRLFVLPQYLVKFAAGGRSAPFLQRKPYVGVIKARDRDNCAANVNNLVKDTHLID